jgi:hypothetical protein
VSATLVSLASERIYTEAFGDPVGNASLLLGRTGRSFALSVVAAGQNRTHGHLWLSADFSCLIIQQPRTGLTAEEVGEGSFSPPKVLARRKRAEVSGGSPSSLTR